MFDSLADLMDFDGTRQHRPLTKKKPYGKIPVPAKNATYQKGTSVHKQYHPEADGNQKAVNSSKTAIVSTISNKPAIIPVLRPGKKRHSSIPTAVSSISAPFAFASIYQKALRKPKVNVKTVNEGTPKEMISTSELIDIEEPIVTIVNDDADIEAALEVSEHFESQYLDLDDLSQYWIVIPMKQSEVCESESETTKYTNAVNIPPTDAVRCTPNLKSENFVEDIIRNLLQKEKSAPKTVVSSVNYENSISLYSTELTTNLPSESMIGIRDKIITFQTCGAKERLSNLPEISKKFDQFSAVSSNKISALPLAEFSVSRKVDEKKIGLVSFPVVILKPTTDGSTLISKTFIIANKNMAAPLSTNITKRAAKLRKTIFVDVNNMPVANEDTGTFAIEICNKKVGNSVPYIGEKLYYLSSEENENDNNIAADVKRKLSLSSLVNKHEDCLSIWNMFKIIMISALCLCLRVLLKILKTLLKN